MPEVFSQSYQDFDSSGGSWYGGTSSHGRNIGYDSFSVNGDNSGFGDISEVGGRSRHGIESGSSGYGGSIGYHGISHNGDNSGFGDTSQFGGSSVYGVGSGSGCQAARNSIIVRKICGPWRPVCKFITFGEFIESNTITL